MYNDWESASEGNWKPHAIMIKLLYLNTNSSPITAIYLLCVKARRGEVAAKTLVKDLQLQALIYVCVSTLVCLCPHIYQYG